MDLTDLELYEQIQQERQAYATSLERYPPTSKLQALLDMRHWRLMSIRDGRPITAPCLLPVDDWGRVDPGVLARLPDGSRIRDASLATATEAECVDNLSGFIEYVKRDGQWYVRMNDREIPARTEFPIHQGSRLNCLTVGDPYLMPTEDV